MSFALSMFWGKKKHKMIGNNLCFSLTSFLSTGKLRLAKYPHVKEQKSRPPPSSMLPLVLAQLWVRDDLCFSHSGCSSRKGLLCSNEGMFRAEMTCSVTGLLVTNWGVSGAQKTKIPSPADSLDPCSLNHFPQGAPPHLLVG